MNEPGAVNAGAETAGAPTYVLPEIRVTPDGQDAVEASDATIQPDAAPPSQVPPQGPLAEAPATEEPPIERRDPFAWMRDAPWMNRKLSPSGRAAILLRRDLDAFPVIEGRDPNHADLDAIVKRTVDYIVPIIKREQATDIAYDEVEKWRADRIAKGRHGMPAALPGSDPNIVLARGPAADVRDVQLAQTPEPLPEVDNPSAKTNPKPSEGTPVILPNGKTVPNEYAPAGVLMSPFANLDDVAAAGRAAFRAGLVNWLKNPLKVEEAIEYGVELIRKDLAQGGRFDYQRLLIPDSVPDYLQLPQFRDVSNFNVGLFMQQVGFPLWATMLIAGKYAEKYSSNYRPDKRDGLDPRTRAWIERGYEAGESGLFNSAPAGDPSGPRR